MLIPSMRTCPPVVSYKRSIRLTVVLFPHPDSPTRATFLPGSKRRFILSRITLLLGSDG